LEFVRVVVVAAGECGLIPPLTSYIHDQGVGSTSANKTAIATPVNKADLASDDHWCRQGVDLLPLGLEDWLEK
jgi:hypothetical protein